MEIQILTDAAKKSLWQSLESEITHIYRTLPAVEDRWNVHQGVDSARLWFVFNYQYTNQSEQGWKLHIAASPSTAITVLRRVLAPLLLSSSSFKVIASLQALSALNQGQYGWSQIGKFITIYPASQQEAIRLASLLDQQTSSLATLKIPSDRALRPGSLIHYRYGSFHNTLYMQEQDGLISPAIRTPTNELIPDRREPQYVVPQWCVDPFVKAGITSELPHMQRILAERYLLARMIAASPTHTLYLAGDLQKARSCVIKGPSMIWEQGDEQINQGLLHEANILTILSSLPQIPDLYACIKQDSSVFLVLEDIQGETIQNYMKHLKEQGKYIETSLAINWGKQIVAILHSIHEHGLVYADLKPSNIIIDNNGQLHLIDFELTDWRTSLHAGERGTRGYSSPRRSSGLPLEIVDDLYSFGALLYFMVTGVDPAEAPRTTELLRRKPGWFSPAGALLQNLIYRCLDTAYISMQELDEALNNLHYPHFVLSSAHEQESGGASPWQQLSQELLHTLCSTACQAPEQQGIFWRSSHTISYGLATRDINTGNAGTLLALCELVGAYPELARQSFLEQAAHWMQHAPFIYGQPLPGLYIGEAGVGAALLRSGQILRDDRLIKAAIERGRLVASLPYGSPDLFHGTAGRLRFHLWLWDETGEQEHLQHAIRCGKHLLDTVRSNQYQELFWTLPDGYKALSGQTYLGYAHGAAGIADALLDLYETTGDERYTAVLCGVSRWLQRQGVVAESDENAMRWPKREGEAVVAAFWCHGAAGIGQFFLHLAQHSLFADASELAVRAANSLASSTRWANPTQCHGLAGNIEFLLDMYQATEQHIYREQAFSLAQCLHTFALEQEGLRVFPSEVPTIFTPDYMVGYGGTAMSILRLVTPEHRPRQLSRRGFRYRTP